MFGFEEPAPEAAALPPPGILRASAFRPGQLASESCFYVPFPLFPFSNMSPTCTLSSRAQQGTLLGCYSSPTALFYTWRSWGLECGLAVLTSGAFPVPASDRRPPSEWRKEREGWDSHAEPVPRNAPLIRTLKWLEILKANPNHQNCWLQF